MTMKILLIEDNYTLRRLYGRTLETGGFEVLDAETVAEARRLFNHEALDIVVCDVEVSDGSTFDFMVYAQAKGIPVLVMSADDNNRILAAQRGLNNFLQKPFPTRSLNPEIGKIILEHQIKQTKPARAS